MAYGWRSHTAWTFDFFLLLVVWTISFYGGAITLFPPKEQSEKDAESAVRNFMYALLFVTVLDAVVTASRTGLFSPWYYLLVQSYYAALAVSAIFVPMGSSGYLSPRCCSCRCSYGRSLCVDIWHSLTSAFGDIRPLPSRG